MKKLLFPFLLFLSGFLQAQCMELPIEGTDSVIVRGAAGELPHNRLRTQPKPERSPVSVLRDRDTLYTPQAQFRQDSVFLSRLHVRGNHPKRFQDSLSISYKPLTSNAKPLT